MRVLLEVRTRHPSASRSATVLRVAARAQCARLGLRGRELSLSLVSDAEMRALNRRHRAIDRTTDVLSFPQHDPGKARGAKGLLGDVVISLPTALRQAKQGGWPLALELRRLLAHGLLHCLGHDHDTRPRASRMARAEQSLLGRAGLVGDSLAAPG